MTRNYASFPAIYELVQQVPEGQVASYGMIASLLPGVTARIVGFAMAATPDDSIPWQRIINSAGKISERPGMNRQRERLEAEGISFKKSGAADWSKHRWQGPGEDWLSKNGIEFMDFLAIQALWPG
ncbi:MAG: cysteine methyltransferase [Alphaproteobacteria bacterium]|nr:MAG: cysteine methyltransferase [Alphaproteobacteria bacterium]